MKEAGPMAWEQWIIPVVLLGGVGALYYFMAKKGISCCGSMMSSGCGRGAETREAPQSRAEAREPREPVEVAPQAPAEPRRPRRKTLVGHTNGDRGER
jgi:hypothetical protein